MPIEFDPAKSRKNAEERGMAFETAEDFEFETAIVRQDTRKAYPEARFQGIGLIGETICFLVFTPKPDGFRVISLRKAKRKERNEWLVSQIRK
ncbi:MAG: BrnT family toxin [Microvirga sp.]